MTSIDALKELESNLKYPVDYVPTPNRKWSSIGFDSKFNKYKVYLDEEAYKALPIIKVHELCHAN